MARNEERNPRPSRVIVTDEAFDELLERVCAIDGHEDIERAPNEEAVEDAFEEAELRRRQFALAVDRAVKYVVTKRDGRTSYTQSLRRYGCRLHFARSSGRIHLIACLALDDDERDHST
jgi:hypothetical protein